jgi:hypothetical protein
MSNCTVCLPRAVPLSRPLPVRWAQATLDAGRRIRAAAASLGARAARLSLTGLLWLVAHERVVHLRPSAGWSGVFSTPEQAGGEVSAAAVSTALSGPTRPVAKAPGARRQPVMRAEDWAALDDRLLRDIGLSDWMRSRAAARREADRALGARGLSAADESATRTARSGW